MKHNWTKIPNEKPPFKNGEYICLQCGTRKRAFFAAWDKEKGDFITSYKRTEIISPDGTKAFYGDHKYPPCPGENWWYNIFKVLEKERDQATILSARNADMFFWAMTYGTLGCIASFIIGFML